MARTAEKKIRVYIDGDAIVADRPSGIGTTAVSLIRALSTNKTFLARYELHVIIAINKLQKVKRWNFNANVKIKKSYIIGRVLNGLVKFHLLPPMDLIFGKGLYIFPNFRNWPLLKSRSVTYIHDVSFKVYPEYVEPRNLQLLERNVEPWMTRTNKVVTVSNFAKEEITKYFPVPAQKIEVVYNGIDETFKPLTEQTVKPALKRYGLTYKKYFMFLSNLEPRKNVQGVLDGYKRFCDQEGKETASLLLVGAESWAADDIKERIISLKEQGYTVVKPDHYIPDEDLPLLINGAASLFQPVFYEGFGISPLQAMACGTQVVVSKASSLPEVVGTAGIYVNEHDTQSMADGLKAAYEKRNTLNKKGIARAAQFTWQASGMRLTSILTTLKQGEV